ncbi:unnamed protein product [Clavelina lepadiformis]|uniref:Uncharacterized protein n=1 Tax=Clavelina lepadiformis TaxID=159417 RepID=A0ABP0GI13_CLALP
MYYSTTQGTTSTSEPSSEKNCDWNNLAGGCKYTWWGQVVVWFILIIVIIGIVLCCKHVFKACRSHTINHTETCQRRTERSSGVPTAPNRTGANNVAWESTAEFHEDKLPSYEEFMFEKGQGSAGASRETEFQVEVELVPMPSTSSQPEDNNTATGNERRADDEDEETPPPPY